MQLIDIVFRERKGYRDMYLRPFDANVDYDLINQLDHDTAGGSDITPAAVSRTASRIIRPSADVQGRSSIVNGWAESRFMFIMKVAVRETRTNRVIYEITGYTDHVGAVNGLRGVKLDPRMALYFNSITRVDQMHVTTPTGSGWTTRILGSEHLIGCQVQPDFRTMNQGTMTMRPHDVFHNNSRDILSRSFGRQAAQGQYMDFRHGFVGSGLKVSDRQNDSSSRYMSKALSALVTANNGEVYNKTLLQEDPSNVLRDARRQVNERSIAADPFFSQMAEDTRILDQGFITYGELVEMNEDFDWDSVKVYFEPPERVRDFSRSTRDWNGRDNTSIAAAQIARALPMYMAYHSIGSITFESNNNSFGAQPVILIAEVIPLLGKRIDAHALAAFEQRIITELVPEMLPWDDCLYDMRVTASLATDIVIDLFVGDEDPAEFAFPVFCDSLVAPVVTDNIETIQGMGSTLTQIVDELSQGGLQPERDESLSDSFQFDDFGSGRDVPY